MVAYDNFNHYYDVRLKEARAQNLTSKGIKVVEGDVCDDVHLHHLFKTYTFTHVAHLAAQAGVRYSLTHPQEYVKNNIQCFVTLLEVLKDYPEVRRMAIETHSEVLSLSAAAQLSNHISAPIRLC